MTRPARQDDADRAAEAFHLALSQIGAETTADAFALWSEVPAAQRAATASGWLRRAITLVMGRRRMARDLARAYYRLARALQTGTTVADPYHPEPSTVTLGDLRRQFGELAGTYEPPAPSAPSRPNDAADQSVSEQASRTEHDVQEALQNGDGRELDDHAEDWEHVLVEELEGLRDEEDRIEREAEEELRTVLDALGSRNLDKRLSQVDDDQAAKHADRQREEAHRQAGAQQAGAAGRVAMNGGRSTIWHHTSRDGRALGYARLSRTGTPCGFCAMLISRGVAYKSERSATYKDGDLFHDHCHCYAEPIFSSSQFAGSGLFELNRQYQALWPEVTKGYSGKAALNAWRRFLRAQQRAHHQAAAQAARQPTTTAQEA
ncbi:VG15 protein [Kitasatospora aureofaciens]|uniref:VG15 protein n=1 Tax=Kitasatospora aureofaciens TaxID=1894 RepID=UPI0036F48B3D